MSVLFADVTLFNNEGNKFNGAEVLKDKVVAVYFSAHWCPACRKFTPVLKDFHSKLNGEFEIVFVSFDRSEEHLKTYLEESHGDWYHVPFGSDLIRELAQKYKVSGVPALVVINAEGEVITRDARKDVQNKAPKQALSDWQK